MQPGFAPPPAKPRGGSRTLLIVGVVAVFLILVLAVGGVLANASLSSTYAPGKAVLNYFAAQSRGDVNYMVANANYLRGSGGTDAFFGKDAVAAMVAEKENTSISNVSIGSTEQLDSATSKVTVTMSWNSSQVTETYTLHKDTSRTHFIFYNDWKIDVPASTISVTLPNQAGAVQVDGIAVPTGSNSISVIQGYHQVTMQQTDFYDTTNQTANAVQGDTSITFSGTFSSAAAQGAAKAIDDTFANDCDTSKYFDCPGHAYKVPAGYYETLPLPGGDVRANSGWVFSFASDPTTGMKISATTTSGEASASGACALNLVVDGKTTYKYTGNWTATLTFNGGNWGTDVQYNCDAAKA